MNLQQAPRRYSGQRLFFYRCLTLLFSRLFPGKAFYRHYLKESALEINRVSHGPRPGEKALRVAQLSDFHAGPFLDSASLGPTLAALRAMEPHVICLTGDYITHGPEDAELLEEALSRLRPVLGTVAVFGNHDYRFRQEAQMERRFKRAGNVAFLRNRALAFHHRGSRFWFIGIEDLEEGKYPKLDQALESAQGDGFKVLLSHNPDVARDLAPGQVDLVLAGHTHGGQINLPFLGALGMGYAGPYYAGLHVFPQHRLYVNRGLGALVVPFRFRARPELTLHLLPLQ